jgi:hypothetical protein
MNSKINLHLLNVWTTFPSYPILWPSAKTYCEKLGINNVNWILPIAETLENFDSITAEISKNPPDIFGVSLYVWNYEISIKVCKWVKENYPDCLVITGGPHQYWKEDPNWFKQLWFLDASLPSAVYGEIAIFDILSNYKNKTINWNTVEQIVFPNSDRSISRSKKLTPKKDFKWNYSLDEQKKLILDYKKHIDINFPNKTIFSNLETTRGCPYSCTFCDWGGGVAGKVILKDLEMVKKDIDLLLDLNIELIYITDANFGINKDRDVDIVRYIAQKKQKSVASIFPYLMYGGFAKSDKHFQFIKEILTIEAENNLSYKYKQSQQSFHEEILDNIKRTDIRAEEHKEISNFLQKKYSYDSEVELIIGLPGSTLDLWCKEFDYPFENNILATVYEWVLLPEAESYSSKYKKDYGIGVSSKIFDDEYNYPKEIVVETYSYTREDYISFIIIYNIYNVFARGGFYNSSIKDILDSNKYKFSDIIMKFYKEVYLKYIKKTALEFEIFLKDYTSLISNNHNLYIYENNQQIIYSFYLMHNIYFNYEKYENKIQQWFLDNGALKKSVRHDSLSVITEKRSNKFVISPVKLIKYSKYKNNADFLSTMQKSINLPIINSLVESNKIILW